jgi:hypothetical protein
MDESQVSTNQPLYFRLYPANNCDNNTPNFLPTKKKKKVNGIASNSRGKRKMQQVGKKCLLVTSYFQGLIRYPAKIESYHSFARTIAQRCNTGAAPKNKHNQPLYFQFPQQNISLKVKRQEPLEKLAVPQTIKNQLNNKPNLTMQATL